MRGERGGEGRKARRGGKRGGHMAMLQRADTDGDKSISRAEFQAAVDARFARADTDGNGEISAAEREAMKQARQERRAQRRSQ